MMIKNGFVFNDRFQFEKKNLRIENGIILDDDTCASDPESDMTSIDAENLYVIPGLIDIHIHGAYGHDFCDNDRNGLMTIAKYLKQNGITSFCPTSMTLDEKELAGIFRTAVAPLPDEYAAIVGINMEGPFLSSSKKGAQNGNYIRLPDVSLFRKLNRDADGLIKLVTIAPELEHSIDFIRELSSEVTISLGHTCADFKTADLAIQAGATHITHLYNAMPPYHHRDPGVIGAAADHPNTMVELISDGIHVHPSVIRNTFRMFGKDRVVFISDSMMATGMPDGNYELGKQTVYKNGKKAVLKDNTLAGSASNLFDCMRNAVHFGIPLEHAIQAVTANPAKSIGIFDRVGSLAPGKKADILLMDQSLNLVKIL